MSDPFDRCPYDLFAYRNDGIGFMGRQSSGGGATNLEELAYGDSADFIYPFTEASSPWVSTGHYTAGIENYRRITGANAISRSDPTVSGSQGKLVVASHTQYGLLSVSADSASYLLRTADRTWELVFTPKGSTQYYWYWYPGSSTNGYGNLVDFAGTLSVADDGGNVKVSMTGMTNTDILDKLCYVAVSWNQAQTRYEAYWTYAGMGSLGSGSSGALSSTTGYTNHTLGKSSNAQNSEMHHFAVYPSVLSESQVQQRLTMIGI